MLVSKQRNVNDFEFYSLSGGTNTTIDLSGDTIVISSEDIYVIAGTYVDNTDTISLLRNDGNFVNITGVTDTFTTGG
jgi:fructose 1,6-bisphosphatase